MRIRMDKRRSGKIAERIGKRERERGGGVENERGNGAISDLVYVLYEGEKRRVLSL